MKFDKNLVKYQLDDVYYDGIKLSITRQNIQDYVFQTQMSGESIILFYYKKELQQLRDRQIEEILSNKK